MVSMEVGCEEAVKKLSIREKNREKRLGYTKLDKTRLKIGTGLFRRLG